MPVPQRFLVTYCTTSDFTASAPRTEVMTFAQMEKQAVIEERCGRGFVVLFMHPITDKQGRSWKHKIDAAVEKVECEDAKYLRPRMKCRA